MKNCLTINNVKINELSGIVSFTILQPIEKNNKLPLIILFGDIHKSGFD
jgi:hypothetical protein